jgi:hypothetical protein
MDEDLKQYLMGMEHRIDKRFGEIELRIDQRFGDMEQRIDQRITQRCEEVETKLLSAFHGWARTMEIRSRCTSTVVNGFDERLSHLEDRVSEIERKQAN